MTPSRPAREPPSRPAGADGSPSPPNREWSSISTPTPPSPIPRASTHFSRGCRDSRGTAGSPRLTQDPGARRTLSGGPDSSAARGQVRPAGCRPWTQSQQGCSGKELGSAPHGTARESARPPRPGRNASQLPKEKMPPSLRSLLCTGRWGLAVEDEPRRRPLTGHPRLDAWGSVPRSKKARPGSPRKPGMSP